MTIKQKNRWITLGIFVGAPIIAFIVFITVGTYLPIKQTSTDNGDMTFITKKNLWGTPQKQHVMYDSGSHFYGPVSSSGKKHGKWTYFNGDSYVEYDWYWYGKEITEGKWHRMSN